MNFYQIRKVSIKELTLDNFFQEEEGTTRFCVYYRRLNSVTLKDGYPLPRIDDMIESLSGASWFSTLDLCMSGRNGAWG